MATNPMQKKARNAFLMGIVIMLVISVVVGALLYLLVFRDKKKAEEEEERVEKKAYVLNQDVSSGQVITENLLSQIVVYSDMIPANYVDPVTFGTFQMVDEDGNSVNTDEQGIQYMLEGTTKVEIKYDIGGYYKDYGEDIYGNPNKEYIKLVTIPVTAKIDIKKDTILTASAIMKDTEKLIDNLRLVEFNMITLPSRLDVGEFVDVRFILPSGQDFIVVSKKEVVHIDGDMIALKLTEEEMLMMSCAIIENYKILASNMYVTKYVDAETQAQAIPTYPPNNAVIVLVNDNPNIVAQAKAAIKERQERDGGGNDLRNQNINPELSQYAGEANDNVEEGIEEQQEKARETRENYLSGLSGY